MNRYRRADDAGFSLVELAVYIVVLGLISTIIATTMVSLFRSESTVSDLTTSASDGQNAATLLRADIRNSRQFLVSGDDGETLTASVAGKSTPLEWRCVRWHVNGSGNDRTLTRDEKSDNFGEPWNAQASLPKFLSGVAPLTIGSNEGKFFSPLGGPLPGQGGVLTYSWKVAASDGGVINIVGDVRNRDQGQVDTPATTCF
ncbi:PulJ/GspJ family protein [Leucobacter sp. W1478]|uniref:PulJ/GspJ family protein n=1 Tax=Leucobacter sp. W1478 TaxID=3439065 RepID=UPI003F328E7E